MKYLLSITIVTNAGVKEYRLGDTVNGKTISKMTISTLHFQGHYVGYSIGEQMLFSVNCLCPCVVEYDNLHP